MKESIPIKTIIHTKASSLLKKQVEEELQLPDPKKEEARASIDRAKKDQDV